MTKFEQKLGASLVKAGVVSDDVVQTALHRQLEGGGRLDTNLLELGAVGPAVIISHLEAAAGLPVATLAQVMDIDTGLIRGFPSRLALRYRIIPFLKERKVMHIIVNDPLDLSLIEEIQFLLNMSLKPYVVPEVWLEYALNRYYGIETRARFLDLFKKVWPEGAADTAPAGPAPDAASAIPSEHHEEYHRSPVTAPVEAARPAEPPAPAAVEPATPEAADLSFAPPAKPYTYPRDFAQTDLDGAASRDEILWTLLKYFWQHFDAAAVFGIASGRAKGWRALGTEAADAIKDFSAPLDEPSVFKTLASTKSHFLGPIPPSAINDLLAAGLGGRAAPNVLMMPLVVKQRLVAVIYADGGGEVVETQLIPDLAAFTAHAAMMLEGLILKKKAGQAKLKSVPTPALPPPVVEPPPPIPATPAPAPLPPAPVIDEPPTAASEAEEPPQPVPAPAVEAQQPEVPPEAPVPVEEPPQETPPPIPKRVAAAAPPEPVPAPVEEKPPEQAPVEDAFVAQTAEPPADEAGLDDIDRALDDAVAPPAAAPVEPSAPSPIDTMPPPPSAIAGEVRREAAAVPPPQTAASGEGAAREDEDARLAAAERTEKVTVDARVLAPGEASPAATAEEAEFSRFKRQKEAEHLYQQLEASGRGVLDDSFNRIVELGEEAIAVLIPKFPGKLRIDPLSQTQRDVAEVEEHSDLIRLLVAIGRPAVEPVCQLTRDPDVNKRFYAVFTFSKLRYPEAIPFLLDRIFDSSPKVRLIALDVLSRFRTFPKFAIVTARLRSEVISNDPTRQRIAAIALGQFKDAESLPQLIKLVGARDEEVAEAAVQALIDLSKQNFGDSERKWMSWWRDNKDLPRVRWLIDGLKHKEEDIRFMAVEELRAMTGNFFSFFHDAPKKERDKSIEKWESWYKNEYKPKP